MSILIYYRVTTVHLMELTKRLLAEKTGCWSLQVENRQIRAASLHHGRGHPD